MKRLFQKLSILLALAVLLQGCVFAFPTADPVLKTVPPASAPAASVIPAPTATPTVAPTATPTAAPTATPAAAPTASPTPAPTPTKTPQDRAALLAVFQEIAFVSEYPAGNGPELREIRKWAGPIRVAVHGEATQDDMAALRRAMDGLNAVPGFPGISLADQDANMDIWFVKLEEMDSVVPGYHSGNWGYFSVSYSSGAIWCATVGIATDVTNQKERNHLIFEEVLQSCGLMQDSMKHPESIFYGSWTTTQQPSAMDWELLGLLYLPELTPGMAEEEAMQVLGKFP